MGPAQLDTDWCWISVVYIHQIDALDAVIAKARANATKKKNPMRNRWPVSTKERDAYAGLSNIVNVPKFIRTVTCIDRSLSLRPLRPLGLSLCFDFEVRCFRVEALWLICILLPKAGVSDFFGDGLISKMG